MIQTQAAIVERVMLPRRRGIVGRSVESTPICFVIATPELVDGTASMRVFDASRASGAGGVTLQRGVAIVVMGKRAAIAIPQAHVK
jgi:hypothetical protein